CNVTLPFVVTAPVIAADAPAIAPTVLIEATSVPVRNPALGVRTDKAPTRAAALPPSAGTTDNRSVEEPGAPTNMLTPPVVAEVPPTVNTAPLPVAALLKSKLLPVAAPMFGVTSVGDVAWTGMPVPVAVDVQVGGAAVF